MAHGIDADDVVRVGVGHALGRAPSGRRKASAMPVGSIRVAVLCARAVTAIPIVDRSAKAREIVQRYRHLRVGKASPIWRELRQISIESSLAEITNSWSF